MITELKMSKSNAWMERAKKVMPGGVSSPVRSFASVGGHPFVAAKAKGAYIYDVDGNQYIDLVGSWGPLIHGHRHPEIESAIKQAMEDGVSYGVTSSPEIKLCEKIVEFVESVDLVRLVNSGTEACMSAIRAARAYTGKDLIVKFDGHYHGHADSFLVAAGSGLATLGMSASKGVPQSVSERTIVIPFNNREAVEECFKTHGDQIAGVMMEVVTGNMGVVAPDLQFMQALRSNCDKHNSVLIFDEVMTGFRLSKSGAQGLYGFTPDLSCFGKVIGGGLPVGAYGGKKEIMQIVAPLGPMYQAGTLSGNPLGSAAGLKSLELMEEAGDLFFQSLDAKAFEWKSRLEAHIDHHQYPVCVAQIGSMVTVFFRSELPTCYAEAKECDLDQFSQFFWALMKRGIYYPPSQFEACFLSSQHDSEIIERVAQASCDALDEVFAHK